MKKKVIKEISVFYASDFPNAATHCPQDECGFSLYKGVLIQWDEDEDGRVITLLDQIEKESGWMPLIIQVHEGTVSFVWDGAIPQEFEDGGEVEVCGDIWSVFSVGDGEGYNRKPKRRRIELSRDSNLSN